MSADRPDPAAAEPSHGNLLQTIHRWSIDHPYAVIAFYVALLALAVMAMRDRIPRRFAPYVQSPMVGVVTMMPGLSAQEVELYISKPVEEQLINVQGLRYIRSSSQDGFSIVTLEFYYGSNMQKALVDVQSLMNVVQSNLPATGANLKPSFVVPIDPLNLPILSLSVRGDPKQGWDPVRVREFADNTVVARLKVVQDVYSVVAFGGYRRQMQVVVDRQKLAAYGLSILEVKSAVDRFNVSRPAGTITQGSREAIVRVNSRAATPRDVMDYPIKSVGSAAGPQPAAGAASSAAGGMSGGGAPTASDAASQPAGAPVPPSGSSPRVVYVRDVARVDDTHWERRSSYHYLKHEPGTAGEVVPSIEVSVIQNPGASSARIVPEVMKVLHELEAENPGLQFEVSYDNAHFVTILFDNVWHELLAAVLLTGLAVLLFLGEWRGTLIAMLTVPTSLALAVLMMVPFGMTFNSGTLIGLLLSIGRLVDDSIIDIHAVERHLRMGKDPRTATIDGIAEVRVAVIASTLMILLALVPLLFSGGIVQLMFVELVWPLIFGLLASMLVSFTLTALLCATLLRPAEAREADRKKPVLGLLYRVLDPVQHLLERLEAGYGRLVKWLLEHRFVNFVRVLAMVIVGFTFYYFIGSEMMPLADVGQANGFLEMAPGTSFAQTEKAVGQLEAIMKKHPELEKASIEIGAESMFESWSPFYTGYQMPQVTGAAMMLTFSDKDSRKRSLWVVIDAIQKEALATIPGIRRLQIKEMGSDVMATAAAPVHVNIYGPDLVQLDRLGSEALDVARKMPEMVQPATTWSLTLPSYEIQVDPQRAQEVGLSPESISQQAYYALRGGLTDEFWRMPNLRQDTIFVRYEKSARETPEDLGNLYLATPDGRQVLLKSVAQVVPRMAPTVIEHDNLRRVIGVTGYYRKEGLPSMDVVMNLVAYAYGGDKKLGIQPVNFPPEYGMEMRGDMTQMMESFRRLLGGLVVSLVLMYLVLVVQFRGFLQPLQMIASLPLELAGVFVALWIAGQAFSTVSILGIIVLTGMDLTTAVLLIDLIMKARDRGVPRDQAVIEACPQRLRPILMTAGISLLVMLPVAVAPKTGLDAYQPLATAVVGGLLVGTILSLFDIPIMHTYVDDFTHWLNRTFMARDWKWKVLPVLAVALLLSTTATVRAQVPSPSPAPSTSPRAGPAVATPSPPASPRSGSSGALPVSTGPGPWAAPSHAPPPGPAVLPPATPATSPSSQPAPPERRAYTTLPRLSGPLTERDVVAIAEAHSLRVAIAREEAVMATADTLAASSQLGLRVSASVFGVTQDSPMIYTTAPGIMPAFITRLEGRREADLNLMAMVPLFTGGRLQALLRGARESEKAALSRTAWELVDVVRDTRAAYAKVLLTRESVEIASWEVSQRTENVRLAESRYDAGSITMSVVLRARAELAAARQRENDARADLEVDVAALEVIMGVDLASDFRFEESLRQPALPGLLEDEIRQALRDRPDLVAARHDVAAAFQAVREARARYAPQVYGQAMAEAMYPNPMVSPSTVGRGYSVGIVASLPLLDGGERKAAVRRSEADRRRRQLRLQSAELEVTRQVSDARARFHSAVANVGLARQEVLQATEDLRVARLRFGLGRAIHLEVLDALTAAARARYDLVKSLYTAHVARADLLRATGRLDDDSPP